MIYRDGTVNVGPLCDGCGHPARWKLAWFTDRTHQALACGHHLARLAPRDQGDMLLTPITPQRRTTTN